MLHIVKSGFGKGELNRHVLTLATGRYELATMLSRKTADVASQPSSQVAPVSALSRSHCPQRLERDE